MHEFSIADALVGQVQRYAPTGRVRTVELRVGALRGLEPEAMRLCWEAVTFDTRLAGSEIVIESLPWSIACPACGRTWTSPEAFVTCECGNDMPVPTGSDELDLMAISLEPVETAEAADPAEPAEPVEAAS